MDEDQFYFGESLNGRSGLVPSNYVERVTDESLLQNASRAPSPNLNNSSCVNVEDPFMASTSSAYNIYMPKSSLR